MGYTLQMAIEYGTSCISNHQTKPDLSMKVGYLKIIQNPMVNLNFPSIFPMKNMKIVRKKTCW